jgi:LPXTG-motif cell wall-anchored protein
MGGNVGGTGLGGLGGDFDYPVFGESNTVTAGTDGVAGVGGNAAANNNQSDTGGAGGGGYGGGGGGAFIMGVPAAELGWGGGGGGSFVIPSATAVSYALRTDTTANGSITLSFGTAAAPAAPAAPTLPTTGVNPAPLIAIAGLLLALGMAFLTVRRYSRRRPV